MGLEALLTLILGGMAGWAKALVVISLVLGYLGLQIIKNLKSLRGQFQNNGGSTMRDAIDRIERTNEEQNEILKSLDDRVTKLESRKWFKKR